MGQIEERVKRVVAQRATDYVVDLVTDEETEQQARHARKEERSARAKALARAAAKDTPHAPAGGSQAGASPDAIAELEAEEDCPVCSQILSAVRGMDEPRRTKGVAEYGEFRRAIEESEEAAVEVLDNSDVLTDALNDVKGMNA